MQKSTKLLHAGFQATICCSTFKIWEKCPQPYPGGKRNLISTKRPNQKNQHVQHCSTTDLSRLKSGGLTCLSCQGFVIRPISQKFRKVWPHYDHTDTLWPPYTNHIKIIKSSAACTSVSWQILTNLDSLEQSTEAQHQSVIDLTFRKPKTHQNSSKLYTPRSTGGTGGTISVVSGSSKRWGVDGSGSWVFCSRVSWSVANCHLMVSINGGTPKSSTLIGFSLINHPFWGTPIYGNPHLMASSKSNGGTLLPGSGSGASASSCSCCGGFFGAFLPPQQPMARRVQTKSSLICRNAKEYLKVQFAKFIRISPSCIDCQVHWFSALISFLGMSWAFTFL